MACVFSQEGFEEFPPFRVSALDRQNAFPTGFLANEKAA